MESHQSVGKVFYVHDGTCYVNPCPSDVDFSQNSTVMDVSPAIDEGSTTSGEAIVVDDDELQVPVAEKLLNVITSMNTDGEEEEEATTPPAQRVNLVMSGAALDLCPVDVSNLPDTDSSTCSEESESEDELHPHSHSSDEDTDSDEESDVEMDLRLIVRAPRPPSWETDLSVDQVDTMIRLQMADIEGKKPWRFVYRCLDIPFHFKRSEDPFDINFMRWDEFWRVHGRAVWERGFWQPLVPGSIESNRRKARQFRAMCAFRQFATELMKKRKKERGDDDEYLKTLSQTLHDGWWYRIEPFRLRNLWYKKRHLYDEYLETRVKLRWPCGKKFLAERGLKPIWWLPDYSPPTCQQ